MAFVLEVDHQWRANVAKRAAGYRGLVPVIKGNGYGFGRNLLLRECATLGATQVAVGTVHELNDLDNGTIEFLVLTPATPAEVAQLDPNRACVLTVGNARDVAAAGNHPIVIKVSSSMRRYGFDAADLPEPDGRIRGYSVHLPLDMDRGDRRAEIVRVASAIPETSTLYVSHIDPDDVGAILSAHAGLTIRHRVGTDLWLGEKAGLQLRADVIEVRAVNAGDAAGYRQQPIAADGHLVMVTAGTAHGVFPLPDGRSPFHFARGRVALHEPPHMHTSMLFVPLGDSCPVVGDRVDVQQPLTRVSPDLVTITPLL